MAQALRNAFRHWRRQYPRVFGAAPPDPVAGAEVLAHIRQFSLASPAQIDCEAMRAELMACAEDYHRHIGRVEVYRELQKGLGITDEQVSLADVRLREAGLLSED